VPRGECQDGRRCRPFPSSRIISITSLESSWRDCSSHGCWRARIWRPPSRTRYAYVDIDLADRSDFTDLARWVHRLPKERVVVFAVDRGVRLQATQACARRNRSRHAPRRSWKSRGRSTKPRWRQCVSTRAGLRRAAVGRWPESGYSRSGVASPRISRWVGYPHGLGGAIVGPRPGHDDLGHLRRAAGTALLTRSPSQERPPTAYCRKWAQARCGVTSAFAPIAQMHA
jgi:hypothetical protein